MIEKRKNPMMTENEMYKLSSIKGFIEKERRSDQLDRLLEVRGQKKVWFSIVFASLMLNLALVVFAIMGYLQNV